MTSMFSEVLTGAGALLPSADAQLGRLGPEADSRTKVGSLWEKNRFWQFAAGFPGSDRYGGDGDGPDLHGHGPGHVGANSRGNYSQAFCINASGQVAGQSSASSTSFTDPAFLYSAGQLSSLGTLGGEYGQARGINTAGKWSATRRLRAGPIARFSIPVGKCWILERSAPITARPMA